MSNYGIDLSGHVGYTGSFDRPAGMTKHSDKPKRSKLCGDSYEARVNRARKSKMGSRWYEQFT